MGEIPTLFSYVSDAIQVRDITISSANWTNVSDIFQNDVSLSGVTVDSELDVSFNVPTDAGSSAKEIIKNIGYIYAAEPISGAIRFFATQAPEYDISATVRGK